MPASLSEAFRSPNSDSASSYTRSSLESLKNPVNGNVARGIENGGNPVYNSLVSFNHSLQPHQPQYNRQVGGCGMNSPVYSNNYKGDTASLISSINTDQFNDEVEQIRRKYNIDGNEKQHSTERTCDLNIYHILSCSKCRKRLKKLFKDDDAIERNNDCDEYDSDDDDDDKPRRKKGRAQKGGAIDLNQLFQQNTILYVIGGIFVLLFLDFIMRIGRLRG